MEVTVTIKKSDVLPEVYKITGYTGVKSNDIDGISSTEDDDALLGSYMEEAANNLAGILSRECSMPDTQADNISFTLTLPANWKQGVKKALQKSMALYIVNFMCMQWFNLSHKDDVKYYADMCTGLSLLVKKYVCERERPER